MGVVRRRRFGFAEAAPRGRGAEDGEAGAEDVRGTCGVVLRDLTKGEGGRERGALQFERVGERDEGLDRRGREPLEERVEIDAELLREGGDGTAVVEESVQDVVVALDHGAHSTVAVGVVNGESREGRAIGARARSSPCAVERKGRGGSGLRVERKSERGARGGRAEELEDTHNRSG